MGVCFQDHLMMILSTHMFVEADVNVSAAVTHACMIKRYSGTCSDSAMFNVCVPVFSNPQLHHMRSVDVHRQLGTSAQNEDAASEAADTRDHSAGGAAKLSGGR